MGHVLYLTSNWQCLVFEVGVMIDRICPAVTRMSIFLFSSVLDAYRMTWAMKLLSVSSRRLVAGLTQTP